MSTAEVLRESGNPAEIPTIHEDMLASIERTAIFSPRLAHIPLFNAATLLEGDRRAQSSVGLEEIEHVTIVGPDAIKFDGQPELILPTYRISELLGLLVLARQVIHPGKYRELGFFKQADTDHSRRLALHRALSHLNNIVTPRGLPIVKRSGMRGGGAAAGIDHLTVTDVRHTVAYKEARRRSSLGHFEAYIRDGGGHPGLFERPSIEAARMALRGFAGSDMTNEQRERFRALSREAASTITHRSDEYDEKNAMDARTNYARILVVDAFKPSWQNTASCGPELHHIFFPPGTFERKDEKLAREQRAKEVCRSCPIQAACLEDAVSRREPYGIWGGTNEAERKQLWIGRTT